MHWHLRSWLNAQDKQKVDYPCQTKLDEAVNHLSKLPPLVTVSEIKTLKNKIKKASKGKVFLLQAGDCAESFSNCNSTSINARLKILQQMSLVLSHGLGKPVTTVGRIAGQYAKPRSESTEQRDGQILPSYRGDLINDITFTEKARQANPERLIQGYGYASTTLNYIRSLSPSIFQKLEKTNHWQLDDFYQQPEVRQQLEEVIQAVKLLQLSDPQTANTLSNVSTPYTSHEALHLSYESALTRERQGKWYNLSTHFPWLGMRTASADSAHLEYLRGIENPIAIKVGPDINTDELINVVNILNPEKHSGKITLIGRYGHHKIERCLPAVIKAIKSSGHPVLWSCDPMHGNSWKSSSGLKSRSVVDIQKEVSLCQEIHTSLDTHLGAIHLEVSGNDVTECTGGINDISETSLADNYQSLLDPRLNRLQALEMSLFIKDMFQQDHKKHQMKRVK